MRPRRALSLLVVAASVAALSGCAGSPVLSGSPLFPAAATMPASWDEAYAEVKDKDVDSAQLSESTRLYLMGFDPLTEKPQLPVRPEEPRATGAAAERFALAPLTLAQRPAAGTSCAVIAAGVGGEKARCGKANDDELSGDLPKDVPEGAFVVGRAFGDGHMVILDRPGDGARMWDAAMHERGHLYAAWLCGRADCLDEAFVKRGYAPSTRYLSSLTEAFAQAWAECHGAPARPEYKRLKCSDVEAVTAEAEAAKKVAKEQYAKKTAQFREDLSDYYSRMDAFDRRTTEHEALARFAERVRANQAPDGGPTSERATRGSAPGVV